MFDFDPRDYDSRDDERYGGNSSRGSRGGLTIAIVMTTGASHTSDRLIVTTTLGHSAVVRATTRQSSHSDEHARDRHDDARWPERDRDHRERDCRPA